MLKKRDEELAQFIAVRQMIDGLYLATTTITFLHKKPKGANTSKTTFNFARYSVINLHGAEKQLFKLQHSWLSKAAIS